VFEKISEKTDVNGWYRIRKYLLPKVSCLITRKRTKSCEKFYAFQLLREATRGVRRPRRNKVETQEGGSSLLLVAEDGDHYAAIPMRCPSTA
jgi:hypothetical protein